MGVSARSNWGQTPIISIENIAYNYFYSNWGQTPIKNKKGVCSWVYLLASWRQRQTHPWC